jgi:hypothetical protein
MIKDFEFFYSFIKWVSLRSEVEGKGTTQIINMEYEIAQNIAISDDC